MRRIAALIMGIFCAVVISIAAVFAWFTNGELIEPDTTGSSVSAYFGGGDGSSGKPFIIKSQRHLYNLAWLQYLGQFNKAGSGNTPDSSKSTMTQYYFSLEADLDMSAYNGIYQYLPPIGTEDNPFVGTLLGNGHSISNLISTNDFSDFNRHPSKVVAPGATTSGEQTNFKANIVGFIGAIGTITGMQNSSLTVSSEANTLSRIGLNTTQVDTIASTTLVGVVAGYVNGTISDVGVVGGKLNVDTSCGIINTYKNLSGYSVVGFAEEEYTTKAYRNDTVVYNPVTTNVGSFTKKGRGNDNDWGGSIAMRDINLRNKAFYSYATNGSSITYTNKEFKVVNGASISREQLSTTSSGTNSKGFKYVKAEDYNRDLGAESGSYLLVHENGWTSNYQSDREAYSYSFLTAVYKDVIELTISDEGVSGFKIKSGDTFLDRDESSITAGTGETVWRIDNSNHIYTYVDDLDVYGNNFNNASTTNQYYLNASTSALSLGTTATTSWSWDSTHNTYVFTSGNNHYGIIYNDGWKVECVDLYKIHDGNGHYLSRANNGTITNTNEANATTWIFSNYSGSGTISTVLNGIQYYLYLNGSTLTTSNINQTSWTNNNGTLYNGANYIQYRQTSLNNYEWIVSNDRNNYSVCYITDNNGNYLSLDSNANIINSLSLNNATLWYFSNTGDNPSGYIFAYINSTKYYLTYNNGLVISSNQSTSWINGGEGLYYNNNYIQYRDGKWIASTDKTTSTRYKIHDGNGNYLSIYGNTIVNETSSDNAIAWSFSNTGNNPSGTISTIINGTTYYLRDNNGLELSTTSTTWSNDGNGIYTGTNYIRYTGEIWTSTSSTSETRYYISSGSNYLSIDSNGQIVNSNMQNAIKWSFYQGNTGYPIGGSINGTTYFLYLDGTNLTASTTNYTEWTYNDSKISYNGYYIQYSPTAPGTYIWMASNQYYYISYDGNFLSHTNNANTLNNQTNISNATLWYFSSGGQNPSGTIRDMSYNISRYIRYNYNSLNQSSTDWTNNNGSLSYYSWRYISYNNGWTTSGTNSQTLIFTAPTVTLTSTTLNYLNSSVSDAITSTYNRSYVVKSYDSLYSPTTISNYSKNFSISIDNTNIVTYPVSRAVINEPSAFCYIPLNVDDNYKVKDTNTGYFVGGGYESTYQEDVRFAAYPASYITSSYTYDSVNGSFKTIYTVNDSASRVPINDNNPGFVKYTESRATFLDTLNKSNNRVYGVHFMNAEITKDTVITAPKVLFNDNQPNKIKYNFEMPEDSIDFYLKSKGYINFFAGYYFNGEGGINSSFFSLHQIERDNYNRIIAFNHITGVYQKDKISPYVYSLDGASHNFSSVDSDGNIVYYDSLPSGYTQVFDSNWIEDPCMGAKEDNYLYYFEIPVNSGEFALGSVSGKAGAYLLYLDIGANAEKVDRTTFAQKTVITVGELEYVKGIQILATMPSSISVGSIDASASAVAKIASGNTGEFTISRTGNTITISDSTVTTGYSSSYIGPDLVLNFGGSAISTTPTKTLSTKTYSQILYADYNIATDEQFFTLITNDGTGNTLTDLYGLANDGTTSLANNSKSMTDWKLYANNGEFVSDLLDSSGNNSSTMDLSSVSIDVSSSTTNGCAYNYQYTNINSPSFGIAQKVNTVSVSNDVHSYTFKESDVTVSLTGESTTIKITTYTGAYVVVINGTTASSNGTITVTAS